MVAEFEPIEEPHAFQALDVTKVKPHSAFHIPQNQWKSLQPDMQPVHTRPVTQEDIQRANKVVAVKIVEITKKYARKGKAQVPPSFPRGEFSNAQVSKNPPPLLPLPVQFESSSFSLENELAKINIFVPLKDLIRFPIYKEAIARFLDKGEINLADECPQIFLGISKANSNPTPFYCPLMINGLILRNCMLDSGASNNIMTLEVTHELGL
jgi:hypothetical protein